MDATLCSRVSGVAPRAETCWGREGVLLATREEAEAVLTIPVDGGDLVSMAVEPGFDLPGIHVDHKDVALIRAECHRVFEELELANPVIDDCRSPGCGEEPNQQGNRARCGGVEAVSDDDLEVIVLPSRHAEGHTRECATREWPSSSSGSRHRALDAAWLAREVLRAVHFWRAEVPHLCEQSPCIQFLLAARFSPSSCSRISSILLSRTPIPRSPPPPPLPALM